MFRIPGRSICLLVMAYALTAHASVAAAQGLTPADRTKALEYLSNTRDQVLKEAATLSDAQWAFKPGPDRWSVGEVVEHLALSESLLFECNKRR